MTSLDSTRCPLANKIIPTKNSQLELNDGSKAKAVSSFNSGWHPIGMSGISRGLSLSFDLGESIPEGQRDTTGSKALAAHC